MARYGFVCLRSKAACAVLFALCLLWAAGVPTHADGVGWAPTWQAAQAEAHASGKPILVDFYTSWCGWCKKLDTDDYPDPQVVKESSNLVCVRMNAEQEGRSLAAKYGVNGYPTLIFIGAKGAVLKRVVGYVPADVLASDMGEVAYSGLSPARLARNAASGAADSSASIALASKLIDKKNYPGARKLIEHLVASGESQSLMPLYWQMGQALAKDGQYSYALAWFTQVTAHCRDPYLLTNGRLDVGQCFVLLGKPGDAAHYLELVIQSPYAGDDLKQHARSLLARARQSLQAHA